MLAWKAFAGFVNPFSTVFDSVSGYALTALNGAVRSIDPANQAKVQAALNIALKLLNVLRALSWLCPAKWQTAYRETVEAAEAVVEALKDLKLTQDEVAEIAKEFGEAVAAWRSPDDATCVA